MKNLKKIFVVLFLLLISFVFINTKSVSAAAPNSFTLLEEGEVNYDKAAGTNTIVTADTLTAYFSYKYTTISNKNYLVFCTSSRTAPAEEGVVYTINNDWSNEVKAGIARIITGGVGEGATTSGTTIIPNLKQNSPELFITQMAIWKYLENKGLYKVDDSNGLDYTVDAINKKYSNGTNVNVLLNRAAEAEKNITEIDQFQATLSTPNLTFIKDGNYYVSNEIKVNGNYDTVSASVNIGKVYGDKTTGFIVEIPASSVTSTSMQVNLKFDVKSKSQYLARNYTPANINHQTTTTTLLDEYSKSVTLTASGTVTKTSTGGGTVRKSKVTISKIDAQTEKPLVGAKLQILNENKEVLYTWTSTEKPYVINGLAVGKYYIKEETAPEGYALSEDMIEFEIKSRLDDQIFIIENTTVVKVPDTGLSKTALMVLGILISLSGIGLIVYGIVKIKNSEA